MMKLDNISSEYIDNDALLKALKKCEIILYADDTLIFTVEDTDSW